MFGIENFGIKFLVYASMGFIGLWFVIVIVRCFMLWFDRFERTTASYKRKLFVFSGFLIASILCFRYAVGLCGIIWPSADKEALTSVEEFFHSFVYSLQIFGVDDGFEEYINEVKAAMLNLFGKDSLWIKVGPVYAAVLSSVAPVAGGAIIFEIIANIFPNIRVGFSYLNVLSEKYYFSELNSNTLALIRSINHEHKGKLVRPIKIITDSYIDDDVEVSVELVNEAKLLGAICVKNDIVHIHKNRIGKRKFFLIDLDEDSNIQKLIELSNKMKKRHVKNSEFYPFVSGDVFYAVEKQVRDNFSARLKGTSPVIIPINGYRNIILNMFSDVPLFEPIVHEYAANKGKRDTELNVTILGMGQIGTEMFLGTYWCGQILGCKLNITVISKESKEEFKRKVDYLNPEIFRSADANDPLLRIYRSDKFAPKDEDNKATPYFSFKYIQADVKSEKFVGFLDNNDDIKNTNYFFVSLGSDNENILMANKLREIIGQSHMISKEERHTVISYVVFDSNLCNVLNETNLYSYSEKGNDIYMTALGSVEQLYSVRNVFLTEFDIDARKAHKKYYSSTSVKKRKKDSQDMASDAYSYSSSVARIVHRPYKVFSAGVWERSIFDPCKEYDASYENQKKIYRENYIKKMLECSKNKALGTLHEFSWLEHRRWNAYMRSRGFRGPCVLTNDEKLDEAETLEYIKRFIDVYKKQKHLELKRHLCLVECSRFGLKADFDEHGKPSSYKVWDVPYDEKGEAYAWFKPDMLDELVIIMNAGKSRDNKKEFKRYDYPFEEIGRYVSADAFSKMTGLSLRKIEKLIDKEKIYGSITLDEDNILMIPEDNKTFGKGG